MKEDQQKSQFFKPGSDTLPVALGDSPQGGRSRTIEKAGLPFKRGDVIDGKFEVIDFLGEGGMGAVYRVKHLTLGKELALKTFRSNQIDQEAWLRFQREAQSIGRLQHENIIRIYDFGISDGNRPYYAMELLHGEDLAEKLKKEGAFQLKLTLQVFIQTCSALEHAHKAGVVHRDIKPANIHLDLTDPKRPVARLVDFGIAKLASGESQRLTSVGLVFGSPLYMSPEQAMGKEIDARSDIYSLGCALFECLTEKPPFLGENIVETLTKHQCEEPPTLSAIDIGSRYPQRLEGLLKRMLEKDAAMRIASMTEVRKELEAIYQSLLATGQGQTMTSKTIGEFSGSTTGVRKPALSHRADQEGEQETKIKSKKNAVPAAVLMIVATGLLLVGTISFSGFMSKPSSTIQKIPTNISDLAIIPGASLTRDKNGNKIIRINFNAFDCGRIGLVGGRLHPSSGLEEYPGSAKLLFQPTHDFINDESKWFTVADIPFWEVRFLEGENVTNKMIREGLVSMTESRSFVIRKGVIDGYLTKLRENKLFNLDIGHSKLTKENPVDVVTLKSHRFALDGLSPAEMDECIDALQGRKRILALRLDDCDIKLSTLKKLSSMPNLATLELRNCNIDNSKLEELSKIGSLRRLHLGKAKLTSGAAEIIRKMSLNLLTIELGEEENVKEDKLQEELSQICKEKGIKLESKDDGKDDYTDIIALPVTIHEN
ncbi:MAG: serine/threonine protein kinase [Candidatus Obscuribacterales bacterium]|nr:serine/threonine protein kinase [Candidatus Obscuribacterales bacterium]